MVLTRLQKALKTASQEVGRVDVYDTQLVEAPKEILKDLGGLVAVQPLRRDDGKLSFIAYWSSSDAATLAGPVLQSRLGIKSSQVSGVAAEFISKPPSNWEKVKNNAVPLLLTSVAVIAALEGLNNRYVTLIAAPQFTSRFDVPTYNVDQGEAVSASLTVENAMTSVELTAINVARNVSTVSDGRPSGSVEMLTLEDASLPPTKTRTYFMRLPNLPSGEHELRADITAKAGKFRQERLVPATARVVVWPSDAEASLVHKQTRQGRADFLLTLRVGKTKESTVACDLKFRGNLTLPNNYYRARGKVPETRWVSGPEWSVLKVTWSAVPGHSIHLAELSLVGNEKADWKKVAADSEPTCSIN